MHLFPGIGGIGKSTALKHLALSWEKGQAELQKFDLVFHIALKQVKDERSLARIVLDQHKGLAASKVSESQMANLLDGKPKSNILVLMDGFDEYHMGTNKHIDSVLEQSSLYHSWVIVTSRPFDKVDDLRQYFDAEATIMGFSDESIKIYASKFFQSAEKAETFLAKAADNQILDILHIPLILQMMCVLFQSGHDLPKSKTQTAKAMVDWSFKYSAFRKSQAPIESTEVKDMPYKLGKLAWESLQSDVQQLLLNKVCKI